MAYNVISYEDRLDRLSRRLPSDPEYAASAILELAGTPLIELFDGDWKKVDTIVAPVVSVGIRSYSTLAETASALEPIWKERCDDWAELRKAGYSLAEQLVRKAGVSVGKGAESSKGKDGASRRGLSASAPMAQTEPMASGQAAVAVISLADRMGECECGRSLAPCRVGGLHYTAFVEGVATATSTKENIACIEKFESSLNVEPGVTYASVLAHAVEYPDAAKSPWLIESFMLAPFTLISLCHELGSVREVELADEPLTPEQVQDMPVVYLGLKAETIRELRASGIATATELLELTPDGVFRSSGIRSLEDVEQRLMSHGLHLYGCQARVSAVSFYNLKKLRR